MPESEDRSQPASRLRREQAREQGQVAHSPELTTAAGLLATVVAISFVGEDLSRALLAILRDGLGSVTEWPADRGTVALKLRTIGLGLAWPLSLIALSAASVSVVAHQFQVRGLWASALIAPDFARLWTPGRSAGAGSRLGRGLWSWLKGMLLIAVSAWVIRDGWYDMLRLAGASGGEFARLAGSILIHTLWPLVALLVVLGAVEFGLRFQRFESMLRMTNDEQREDQRTMEGDPAVRAERRRLVRTWRSDSSELFTGARFLLLGANGLTLVIAGGPPPARVDVRSVAKGSAGVRLRRSPAARDLPRVEAADLARRLSLRPVAGAIRAGDVMAGLSAIWPRPPAFPAVDEPAGLR